MQTILESYIECALWSSTGVVSEEDLKLDVFQDCGLAIGDDYPLDDFFGEDDLAPETLATMESEIADFLDYCEREGISREEWSDEQLGHDFWLTRNRHGAGFWDRGFAAGKVLSDAAHTFGESDLYVGDSGMLYVS